MSDTQTTGWAIVSIASALALLACIGWLVKAVVIAGPVAVAGDRQTLLFLPLALIACIASSRLENADD